MRSTSMLHTVGALVAAGGVLAAAACGSGHGGAAAAAPPAVSDSAPPTTGDSPASGPSATPSPVGTDPTPLSVMPETGTDLMTFMAHPSALGPDFTVDTAVDATLGDRGAPSTVDDVAKTDCKELLHSSWTVQLGNGQATAMRLYKSHNTQEVSEDLDLYEDDATAESVMKNVGRLGGVCDGFTDPDSELKVAMKTRTLSGVGDQAYLVTLTNPQWQENGNILVAVRVGDVVATFYVLDLFAKDGGVSLATKAADDVARKLKAAS